MATSMIFVNLPITDQAATRAFWTALGYGFNEDFCSAESLAVVLSDSIHAMLLSPGHFAEFTVRPTADGATEAILALAVDSRDEVDRLAEAALAHGGAKAKDAQDHGFMYGRSFLDPDGHHWEILWMNPAGMAG